MKAQFFGDWGNEADVARDFQDDSVLDFDIIVAWYTYEDYSGSAYVIARKGDQLFETSGGHCSCYGLEGQWQPAAITLAYLNQRLERGGFPGDEGLTKAVRRFVEEQQ